MRKVFVYCDHTVIIHFSDLSFWLTREGYIDRNLNKIIYFVTAIATNFRSQPYYLKVGHYVSVVLNRSVVTHFALVFM